MARQNRVTPAGELVEVSARGLFMGNRGCLHDVNGTIGKRRWTTKSWVCCALEFNGWKRELMAPGSYTELFFLDEATALTAGHRPCWECRRDAYNRYMSAIDLRSAVDANNLLHPERTKAFDERPIVEVGEVPDGTIVSPDGSKHFFLKWNGRLLRWSFDGYELTDGTPSVPLRLVTPPTSVRALAAGYPVALHPTANAA